MWGRHAADHHSFLFSHPYGIRASALPTLPPSLPAGGHENLVKSFGFCDETPGCPIFLELCGGDLFDAAVEGNFFSVIERIR